MSSSPALPFGRAVLRHALRVTFHVKAGGADVTRELPIQYRYVRDIFNGDKRMELNVVPASRFACAARAVMPALPVRDRPPPAARA